MAASIVTCDHCRTRNRIAAVAEGVPRCANCHEPLPWLVDVGPDEFDAATAASVPVLVDLWAPWCGPCRQVTPVVEALAHANPGQLKVVKLNVDSAPEISARYDVRGIPTLLLVRDGTVVDRVTGAAPRPQIEGWLGEHIGAAQAAEGAR